MSYLTFLDVYCVSSMVFVFAAMVWHTVFIAIHDLNPILAVSCDKYAMFVFLFVILLEHLVQLVWWFVAMERRRELENLDESAEEKFLRKRISLLKEKNDSQLNETVVII